METNLNIIKGNIAIDDRGSVKYVNDFDFKNVKRFYQIQNHRQGYIRAWHGHLKEGINVYVIKGTALIGAVYFSMSYSDELAQNVQSQTDPKKFVLSSDSPSILYIPPGYANGFKTLTDNCIIQFFSTSTLEESKNDDIRFPWDKWNIWTEDFR